MSAWPEARLEDVARIERQMIAPDAIENGATYLGLEHIEAGGRILERPKVKAGDLRSTKFAFDSSHVLYGKLRPYLAKIALPDFAGVCTTEIVPIQPGPDLERRFLAYFLRQPEQVKLAAARATGINLPRLSPTELAALRLPLPPLDAQKRIADILDEADALRAKRREALATLDEMARAIFTAMFVANPTARTWPKVTIGSAAKAMRTGPFGSQLLHSEFTDAGVAVLGIDNAVRNSFAWDERRYIPEEKFRQLSRFQVFPGDVIITIMGTCGRAAVVPDDIPRAISTKHLCCITLDVDRCLPSYLHACFLHHPHVHQQLGATAKGAVMPGLNLGLIRDTEIPLPPIALQTTFVEQVKEVSTLRDKHGQAMDHLDSLFASLQHRAFRGEL